MPKNGDTTIKEGNKFVYKNGVWTLATKASTTDRRRTGQNSSVVQLKTTPGAGRRVQPKKPNATPPRTPAPTDAQLRREGYQIDDGVRGRQQPVQPTPAKPTAPRPSGGTPTRSNRSTGGGSGGGSRTYASTMPAVVTRSVDVPSSRQTGNKEKDMATWAQANKKLGEALGKRNSERGTSRTTNPLMKDMIGGMKKREDAQDQQNGTGKYFGPPSPGKSASNAPSASNKFNTKDSLYTPKTKLSDDEERRRRAMGMKSNYGQYSG